MTGQSSTGASARPPLVGGRVGGHVGGHGGHSSDGVSAARATADRSVASDRGELPLLRAPVLWGVAWGLLQAASPLAFWWLPPATVYAFGLAIIAAIYVGFAVADGRRHVIVVEVAVAALFVLAAAAGVTGWSWLLVIGLAGHGWKDLWQHRSQFVRNTRWWPPFCATVDWVAAAIIATLLIFGAPLR